MNVSRTIFFSVLLALGACSQDDTENRFTHDNKYNSISVDNDACVFDQQTGLLWEAKTDIAGLHDFRNTYTWYDPNEAHKELDYRGLENGGVCAGSACDTWHYVEAVNQAGYCGYQDWRMPFKDELFSISDLLRADNPPTMNTNFFMHAQAAEYWSGNDYSFQWDAAWAWNFEYGHDRVDWKKTPKFVRLVRGSASQLPEVKE
ncbi:MAG: DUF1566 domain-containing protein [Gammaproteobacteria bacterium]|nr:DUF1566 domain-containing protein [Gammaproteobacteria bacterium]NND47657.1 DUF1566 domain-containing protein [Woeseiaceae bacterium]NNL44442.1 DUF1566 domain-containing protein [Woeseiaceae bacterium]